MKKLSYSLFILLLGLMFGGCSFKNEYILQNFNAMDRMENNVSIESVNIQFIPSKENNFSLYMVPVIDSKYYLSLHEDKNFLNSNEINETLLENYLTMEITLEDFNETQKSLFTQFLQKKRKLFKKGLKYDGNLTKSTVRDIYWFALYGHINKRGPFVPLEKENEFYEEIRSIIPKDKKVRLEVGELYFNKELNSSKVMSKKVSFMNDLSGSSFYYKSYTVNATEENLKQFLNFLDEYDVEYLLDQHNLEIPSNIKGLKSGTINNGKLKVTINNDTIVIKPKYVQRSTPPITSTPKPKPKSTPPVTSTPKPKPKSTPPVTSTPKPKLTVKKRLIIVDNSNYFSKKKLNPTINRQLKGLLRQGNTELIVLTSDGVPLYDKGNLKKLKYSDNAEEFTFSMFNRLVGKLRNKYSEIIYFTGKRVSSEQENVGSIFFFRKNSGKISVRTTEGNCGKWREYVDSCGRF